MNGGADLGGMMGFGPIVEEQDEPLFHAPWEARALGIVVALGACGQWNIDHGMIDADELAHGRSMRPAIMTRGKLTAQNVDAVLSAGGPADRPPIGEAKYTVGDCIRTINDHPQTHTRMARYARGKSGIITKVHGFHVFPDSNAQGLGEDPQWLYQVTFASRTLWGAQGNDVDTVSLDLWEPYLMPQT